MKYYNRVLLLGTMLGIAGCSFPGQRVDDGRYEIVNAEEDRTSEEYDLLCITPRVLRELAATPSPLPNANPELRDSLRDYRYRVGPQDVLTFTVWVAVRATSRVPSPATSSSCVHSTACIASS